MASNITFTLIRYAVLSLLLVAGVLIVVSVARQDWMREELKMKMGPLKKINMSSLSTAMAAASGGMAGASGQAVNYMDYIPDDATADFMGHFGLRQLCIKYSMSGLGNPMQLAVPVISWCVKNDVFSNPKKYKIPSPYDTMLKKYFDDEMQALKHAYICMALALLFVVVGVILSVIKAFRWQKPLILSSFICCILACVCVVAALGVVHANFEFKDKFEQVKALSKMGLGNQQGGTLDLGNGQFASSRKRRDDGSPGYSEHYKKNEGGVKEGSVPKRDSSDGGVKEGSVPRRESRMESGGDYSGMGSMNALGMDIGQAMGMLMHTEMKETIGSPLVYAGLSVGVLLLVALLCFLEYFLMKRSTDDDVKYQNVTLT